MNKIHKISEELFRELGDQGCLLTYGLDDVEKKTPKDGVRVEVEGPDGCRAVFFAARAQLA